MYSEMLSRLVCMEYEDIVEDCEWPNNKGVLIRFSVKKGAPSVLSLEDDERHKRYHSYELLIYGKTNYVGVYMRETLSHPDHETDWYCLACHDSCWRSDAVERFFDNAEKYIIGFMPPRSGLFNHPFDHIDISEEEVVVLRAAEKARLGHNYREQVIHPLMEYKR